MNMLHVFVQWQKKEKPPKTLNLYTYMSEMSPEDETHFV